MGNLLAFLRNLGTVRLTIMGAVLFGLVFFFTFMISRLTGTNLELLFAIQDPTDQKAITTQLSHAVYRLKFRATEFWCRRTRWQACGCHWLLMVSRAVVPLVMKSLMTPAILEPPILCKTYNWCAP